MVLRRLLTVGPVLLVIAACARTEEGSSTANLESAPISKALCAVTKPGDATKVFKGTLLLPEKPVEGELVVDAAGIIQCADATCANAPGYATATVITCHDAAISPGLINAHEHITYANNAPPAPATERYESRNEWRKGLNDHHKLTNFPGKDEQNHVPLAELRFLMSGVTSIASGAGGSQGLIRNVDNISTQLEGMPLQLVNSDTFPLKDSGATTLPAKCEDLSSGRMKASTIEQYDAYLPHIAEGINDAAHVEFICQSGGPELAPLPDFNLIKPQTAVIHGVGVDAADVARYRPGESILIWSPRSNVSLYGNTAPIAMYANLGVPIALGTDWLPSGSMNMSRELACADFLNQKYFDHRLSDRMLWQTVTSNPAFAIGAGRQLGYLKAGYVADISIYDAKDKPNPYRAVIEAGVEDTVLVMRQGKALYGDADLMKDPALTGDTCEDLPVCGFAKKVCVKQDTKKFSLDDLKTAAGAIYPMFYCKGETPKNEPTCVPQRGPTAADPAATVYTGEVTATDSDGDGIPDDQDNCPHVFNPVRPMDHGHQPQIPGHTMGEACDPCPFGDARNCSSISSDDMDGDGVPDWLDNCPEVANPPGPDGVQADADHDGKGDACDLDSFGQSCADKPNPGAMPCPGDFKIAELRDTKNPHHPKPGKARAHLVDVYVTGIKDFAAAGDPPGFFIQQGVEQFSGMFVATDGPAQGVKVGNKLEITGDYNEDNVNGFSQLVRSEIKVTDPGETLPFAPVKIDPAIYANKTKGLPWETMLCEVPTPTTVTVQNADGAKDFDEFQVTDAQLRIDDTLYAPLGNDYYVGSKVKKLIGICAIAYGNRKIWPRSADDFDIEPAAAPPLAAPDAGAPDASTPPPPPPPPNGADAGSDNNTPKNPPGDQKPKPDDKGKQPENQEDPSDLADQGGDQADASTAGDPNAAAKRKQLQSRESCTFSSGPLSASGALPFGLLALAALARRRRSNSGQKQN